jgi:hypothetical protein
MAGAVSGVDRKCLFVIARSAPAFAGSQGQACTRAGECRPWQSNSLDFRLLRFPFDFAQG